MRRSRGFRAVALGVWKGVLLGPPAPSAAWDPGRSTPRPPSGAPTIALTVHLPDDAVLQTRVPVGATLLTALEGADLSDVWEGGACGGGCSCSTCRVVVTAAPAPLPPRGDDEADMLDVAAAAAAKLSGDDAAADAYLSEASRLACQITLRPEDDGLVVTLPEDVTNVLEVPLWLRGDR